MSPAAAAGRSCCCSPRSGSAGRTARASGAGALPAGRGHLASRDTASRTFRSASAWPISALLGAEHARDPGGDGRVEGPAGGDEQVGEPALWSLRVVGAALSHSARSAAFSVLESTRHILLKRTP